MALVLQIFGAAFLLLIVLAIAGLLYLRWKLRSLTRNFKQTLESFAQAATASQTPSRLHLRPIAVADWSDEPTASELTGQLRGLGFEPVGTFHADEVPGLLIDAWLSREARAWGIVYEHPQAGVWLDLVCQYDDGRQITYANTAQGSGVDHSPGHDVIRLDGLDARALFRRFVDERPVGPLTPLEPEEFVTQFEQAYSREMDWRNSRGGATADEIRRIAALAGETYDEETLRLVEHQTRQNAFAQLERSILDDFLIVSAMPASEWEKVRDVAFVVHDGLDVEALRDRLEDLVEVDDLEDLDGSAREAFAAYNARQPVDQRCRKLGSVDSPVEADIYAAPA